MCWSPAIAYASEGLSAGRARVRDIKIVEQLFREALGDVGCGYLPTMKCLSPAPVHHPKLSQTYARILKEQRAQEATASRRIEAARKAWSHGFIAGGDSTGSAHAGSDGCQRLAASRGAKRDDMARWQPTVEAPLTYDYGRYTVCKPGVWSQGPVMLQQLALLKGFELDGLDPAGPEFIHLQIECAKLAFADREEILWRPEIHGDPDRDPAVGRLQRRAPQADLEG